MHFMKSRKLRLILKELCHHWRILEKLAKLFKILISNPIQSSASSTILVPFCFRIGPLVFFLPWQTIIFRFPSTLAAIYSIGEMTQNIIQGKSLL